MLRLALAAGVVVASLVAAGASEPWTADELKTLASFRLQTLGPPPPDPSNRYADDPDAAALGKALFSDVRLSANGKVSCATCHLPERAFTDDKPLGEGVGTGNRRTMPVIPAVYSHWQFWDGRADSLWAQALGPVENPVEHGFTRTEVVQVIATHYRAPYEARFGALPDLSRAPVRASPAGDAAAKASWQAMSAADRRAVDRAYANFGKSVAAFERTLRTPPTRFDAWLDGVTGHSPPTALSSKAARLTPDEQAGLRLFIGKARCSTCHNGPLFTNHEFHNTGVPTRPGATRDDGRGEGLTKVRADPFNCRGDFSDAKDAVCDELDFAADGPELAGQFKVPSLRGVAGRAPYMHAGQVADLEAALDHYDRAAPGPSGKSELQPLGLTPAEKRRIIAFLRTLEPIS